MNTPGSHALRRSHTAARFGGIDLFNGRIIIKDVELSAHRALPARLRICKNPKPRAPRNAHLRVGPEPAIGTGLDTPEGFGVVRYATKSRDGELGDSRLPWASPLRTHRHCQARVEKVGIGGKHRARGDHRSHILPGSGGALPGRRRRAVNLSSLERSLTRRAATCPPSRAWK